MKPSRLPIDFSARRRSPASLALALIAAALAVVLAVSWWTGEQHLAELRRQVAAAERHGSGTGRLASAPLSTEAARSVNEAIARLNTPWDRLFAVLKAAHAQLKPGSVALLSLEPDAVGQAVKVTAEARTVEAMLAYQRALQAQEAVQAAVLMRHEISSGASIAPIRFSLETRLAPDRAERP
jgi:hypothetical protein